MSCAEYINGIREVKNDKDSVKYIPSIYREWLKKHGLKPDEVKGWKQH